MWLGVCLGEGVGHIFESQSIGTCSLVLINESFLNEWMLCYTSCVVLAAIYSLTHVQLFATPWTIATRLLCPQDSPGRNTGVGSHFLLQGGLPDPGTEPQSAALAGGFLTTILEAPGEPCTSCGPPQISDWADKLINHGPRVTAIYIIHPWVAFSQGPSMVRLWVSWQRKQVWRGGPLTLSFHSSIEMP